MTSPTLTDQIEMLEILRKRIQNLRAVPIELFQTRKAEPGSAADALKAVRQISDEGLSDDVQGALGRAKESLESDGNLDWTRRREKRKPRCAEDDCGTNQLTNNDVHTAMCRREPVPVTNSPEALEFGQDEQGTQTVFPPLAEGGVKMEGLTDWAREFNRTHKCKVRIQGQVLRVTIPDVMTVYMSFGVSSTAEEFGEINVETVRVFGPREAKGVPYGQSAFGVFQLVSQQFAKVLEQETGHVKLQNLVGLVTAYSSLFYSPCRVCGRVVASDGHVPAIVRRWQNGEWIGEHVTCSAGAAIA